MSDGQCESVCAACAWRGLGNMLAAQRSRRRQATTHRKYNLAHPAPSFFLAALGWQPKRDTPAGAITHALEAAAAQPGARGAAYR